MIGGWCTTEEAAEALGISRRTVVREIDAGVLEAAQRKTAQGRTRIRVHVDALRAYCRHDNELTERLSDWLQSRSTFPITGQQGQQAH